LEDFYPHEMNPSEEGGKKQADEEEEEGHGGQRVQCG